MIYGFESGLNIEMEAEVTIPGGMRVRREMFFQTPTRDFFRTDAFDHAPGLMQTDCSIHCVLDLISARERASVEKHYPRRIFLEKVARGREHEFLAKIILASGIFDFVGGK
jgi:hypothetical protein